MLFKATACEAQGWKLFSICVTEHRRGFLKSLNISWLSLPNGRWLTKPENSPGPSVQSPAHLLGHKLDALAFQMVGCVY
ncbi:hypothetical protein SBA5_560008 [Candidatus Sulfotelmatomonas gaucii]|uniref:Uncharacterized protein n=1 Tax=Candidatus Sulfuritelmatomonas gaucii TaxID=2043161 RepID=A0A2N9LUC5_9BACT|nr:hypothetical protein SBA5_560008 [Candidatus Sulfotelmatomonas gaucii]